MDCEGDKNMCEKILKRLESIIKHDPLLEEFSLIPTCIEDVDKNVSPIKYIREEHCLGLETWCVKHVFKYAQEQVFKLRKNYKNHADILNRYLIGALLIQPEVTTFWNIKRDLVNVLDFENELKFSKLVLSYKNKSYQAYVYRSWLILNYKNEVIDYQRILEGEFRVLDVTTRNTLNNYHAWNHRIWCFENIILPYLPISAQFEELKLSENWILSHVSEHTGFHYRQYILNRFKNKILLPNNLLSSFFLLNKDDNSNLIISMLDNEYLDRFDDHDIYLYNQYICLLINELFKILSELHSNYPGHESVWYHRRFVFYHIYKTICEIYGVVKICQINFDPNLPDDVNIVQSNVSVHAGSVKNYKLLALESSFLFKTLVGREKEFLSLLSGRNQWNSNDGDLLLRYKKWLICVLGINICD